MTTTEPIPDQQFGIANWQDYINNWREVDAEYLQARTIARFANTGTRDTAIPAPSPGQFVYDQNLDILEMRSKTNAWVPYRALPQNLAVPTDDGTSVILAHSTASGKGLVLGASTVGITGNLNVLNGLHTVDPTGMTIKSGSRVAKLSTDTANLISDTPLSVPSIALSGTGTVISAAGKTVAVGTLTADSATITNISMSGTLTGGVLNGTSGVIGGVNIAGNTSASFASNRVTASDGLLANGGRFTGNGSSALMSANGGGPYLQVDGGGGRYAGGGQFDFQNTVRLLNGNVLVYYNSNNSVAVNVAPSLYSAGDPGAGNFPEGTIWVN